MLAKPRLIFVLLWDKGHYVLSRNFRLQTVGTSEWLQKNYNFNMVAKYIDELVVLNVSREDPQKDSFAEELCRLTEGVFTPVTAGGWLHSCDDVSLLLNSGADRVVVNSLLFGDHSHVIEEIAKRYGSQCILASIDVRRSEEGYDVYSHQGQHREGCLKHVLLQLVDQNIGEILVTSIDRDGTGMGFDLDLTEQIRQITTMPFIVCGGAGNARHFEALFKHYSNGAGATAHLFNFIGNGLDITRQYLLANKINLARWDDYSA